jgi:hypothetical protein
MVALRISRVMGPISPIVVWGPEAADPDHAPIVHLDDGADPAVENECMARASSPCVAMISFLSTSRAAGRLRQLFGELGVAQRLGQPVAQRTRLAIALGHAGTRR